MPLFDDIHHDLKTEFMRNGLMLGQFYKGCPQAGIYDSRFRPLGTVPWPCFAIRYMAAHDHLFFDHANTAHATAYGTYFPDHALS